jgi:hypothetical protein
MEEDEAATLLYSDLTHSQQFLSPFLFSPTETYAPVATTDPSHPLPPSSSQDADPLSVDLLATFYDAKSRPPPFDRRHIATYMDRLAAGGLPVEIDPGECVLRG